jgi:hypothetical protein
MAARENEAKIEDRRFGAKAMRRKQLEVVCPPGHVARLPKDYISLPDGFA